MSTVSTKHVNLYTAGCVTRRHGYMYLWTKPERFEQRLGYYPLAYYVKDPPVFLTGGLTAWGLCSQGITYQQYGNVTHAFTVVGMDNYPNAADVLEEWLNGWPSTLAPDNSNAIKMLTPGESKLFVVHGRGWINDWKPYRDNFIDVGRGLCLLPDNDPQHLPHLKGEDMCAALHWQHIIGKELERVKAKDRRAERHIGQHVYPAVMPINGVEPECSYAIIAWRPVDEIHVVDKGIDDLAIQEAIEWLTGAAGVPCQLPVFVTDN